MTCSLLWFRDYKGSATPALLDCLNFHNLNDSISYFMTATALSYIEETISQQIPWSSGFYKLCGLHSTMFPDTLVYQLYWRQIN